MGKKKFFVSLLTLLLFVFFLVQTVFAGSSIVLKAGMTGDTVSGLQEDLKALGYMSVSPTGYFGDITKAAVIKLQKKYGLTQDGIAGPQTFAKIDALMGRKTSLSRGNNESLSQKIIDYAKRFLGVKYVWGGSSPKGFDCSGFVKYVFGNFGINLVRTSTGQAKEGSGVTKSDLQMGDLVFFDTNGGQNGINHVGIYIGSGKFIQSSSGSKYVVISSISEGFYKDTYMKARRVIN